ncbi:MULTISPECIES: cytochrome-c oxidase, cbb3-type subunit III [unclassified Helicobacter]|uniref:cytochrome-c oxidase, cbb3-type subunit III n=1 Tax=unclassified Helicobacter TaxID=2593540 RepID=UPI000CF058BA|nr:MULTISPECIES: cytochrome-c oxidase, cbb3-type subunit III [unclassified Helicobacter]
MGWLDDKVNLIALIGAVAILFLTMFFTSYYIRKMRDSKAEGKLKEHGWDGIAEFANDIPIGWVVGFIVIIIWGLWYVFLGYPLNSYSQLGEYNLDRQEYNQKFEDKWKNLSQDDMVKMGQSIFLVKCSQCHGVNAEGISGRAQNLTRWGKYQGIEDTIHHGSSGLEYLAGEMPAVDMNPEDAKIVSQYVMSAISDLHMKFDGLDIKKGKELWDSASCSSCHGEDGKGLDGLAVDLTKYGTTEFLKEILAKGKKGHIGKMPSFDYAKFSDIQIKALNAYINSLQPLDE